MKPLVITLVVVAFAATTAVSFLLGRFLRGFLFGIACLFVYLITASLHAAGWKLDDGLLFLLGWNIAVVILLGPPAAVGSAIAAIAGAELSDRLKSHAFSLDQSGKRTMLKHQKVFLSIVVSLTLGLMVVGGITIR